MVTVAPMGPGGVAVAVGVGEGVSVGVGVGVDVAIGVLVGVGGGVPDVAVGVAVGVAVLVGVAVVGGTVPANCTTEATEGAPTELTTNSMYLPAGAVPPELGPVMVSEPDPAVNASST
jgi:hypothetical protein